MIELFYNKKVKATFFCIGDVVKQNPNLFKRLNYYGHEIASHGLTHQRLDKLSSNNVSIEVVKSKKVIEDKIGIKIKGFRAPGFSITKKDKWILDIIKKAGYEYDSSVISSDRLIYKFENELLEIAPNGLKLLNKIIPINGGFFF